MRFSEETLVAYVDDELDAAARVAVETAMTTDPELKRYVERQLALRAKLRATFDHVLDEPVPERLLEAARTAPSGARDTGIADLAAARAAKTERSKRRWALPEWGAMAASLVVGLFIGQAVLRSPHSGPLATRDGHLVAQGALAHALTSQLASNQPGDAAVQIGVSFRDKAGDYCRTFVLRSAEPLSGLACREDDDWRMEVLAQGAPASANADAYRMAGAELPEAVFRAVEAKIAGEPLDADQETAAQRVDWQGTER